MTNWLAVGLKERERKKQSKQTTRADIYFIYLVLFPQSSNFNQSNPIVVIHNHNTRPNSYLKPCTHSLYDNSFDVFKAKRKKNSQ